jgi:hypothetical protein
MRIRAVAALGLAAVALAGAGAVPAQAAVEPMGLLCAMQRAGTGAVMVHAGPLTLTDGTAPVSGRVTCSVHADSAPRYADASLGAATSPTTTGAVVLPPTPLAVGDVAGYVCTRVDVDSGPSQYFDAATDAWTSDPSAECTYVPGGVPGCDPSYCDLFGDGILCPAYSIVFPPEGDIPGIWDCPPYDARPSRKVS